MSDSASLPELIEAFAGARVLCLGDAMLDRYVYGTADRVSPEAPIPVLRVEREEVMAGGAANVARNALALGAEVSLIAALGADDAGRQLRGTLDGQTGLDVAWVESADRPTTVKIRFIGAGQQLLRADHERDDPVDQALAGQLLAELERRLSNTDVLLLSDYAKGVLSDRVLPRAIELARTAGIPIIADPKRPDFEAYRGVDLLKPNLRELREAVGRGWSSETELIEAARSLAERCGLGALLVTRSEHGMTLVDPAGEVLRLPAEAREIYDVSGAGDTVLACLGVAMAAGGSWADAARLANRAGGLAVGRVGTASVRREDLERALRAESLQDQQNKILPYEEALAQVEDWRRDGLRVGFTNGCFDLLHPGHISLLDQARAACDRLVVGVNSDASTRRLKGEDRPIQTENSRAIVLASLAAVDLVVIFEEDTPQSLIEGLRPELLVKGADYRLDQVVGAKEVESWGGEVKLVTLREGHSTTGTVSRLRR